MTALKSLYRMLLLVLAFFCLKNSYAQGKKNTNKIENLVFEGGGVRGIAYAGVLKALEEKKILEEVKRVGGTSAGAITALMVSIGYSAAEFKAIIDSTDFSEFNDGKHMFVGGTKRLVKQYGWYKGEAFLDWLGKLIKRKCGNENITFSQLKEKGFKELKITGTCLNKQKLIVFSNENYPNMPIKNAVRISMAIPYYFGAVFTDSSGKIYDQNIDSLKLDVMVDGGVLANYPFFLFDEYNDHWSEKSRLANPATLGFMIEEESQLARDSTDHQLAEWSIENVMDFSSSIYNVILGNMTRNTMTEDDWKRTVVISSKSVGPKVRKLSKKEKQMLISSGYKSTLSHLEN